MTALSFFIAAVRSLAVTFSDAVDTVLAEPLGFAPTCEIEGPGLPAASSTFFTVGLGLEVLGFVGFSLSSPFPPFPVPLDSDLTLEPSF